MNLDQIAKSTGLGIRRVRYVLDHRVLRGTQRASKGHRVTRTFTPFEAFGIAVAGWMFEGGLRRPLVTQAIRILTRHSPGAGSPLAVPLYRAFSCEGPGTLAIADGRYIRLQVTGVGGRGSYESGWFDAALAEAVGGAFAPVVLFTLDVGRVRAAIIAAAAADEVIRP